MPPQLRLLGQATAELNGQLFKIAPAKPAALLLYLATSGRWVSRAELAFLYRPDEPEAKALAYLRKLVFRARRLPWADGLEVTDDALRWQAPSDLSRFRAAADAGSWETALSEHGGEFLAGWAVPGAPGIEEWLAVERAAQLTAWLGCAAEQVARFEHEGRATEATALLEEILEVDAYDERSLQRYMLALAQQGRRGQALQAYARFEALLASELSGVPLESTQALADAVRAGNAEELALGAPVAQAAPAPPKPAAVPSPSSVLVGRAAERELISGILKARSERLVSIVGLGGSGKTRLAVEVAPELGDAFEHGVAFVSFAGEDPSAAGSESAAASRLLAATSPARREGEPEEALLELLKERELLLVLDNFESVIDAAPLVARLLAGAPRLAVLVTSREPLRIAGERLIELRGLELPGSAGEGALEEVESVRLFTQVAVRVAPQFTPTRSNLARVAEICRRLDGLPLAIELAASWSGVLGPEALLRELERDLDLLSSRSRDVPDRHSSLATVFDHTWERLGERERSVLARLSLFRAGFDLAAARAVAGCDLEVLLNLIAHMLVRRVGEDRYVLHELVRQYAGARLPEAAWVRAAHARHYCGLLERLLVRLRGSELAGALERIATDYANFVAAWEAATDAADPELLGAAEGALDFYLYYRGRYAAAAESFARAAAALERATEARAEAVRGLLLLRRAQYEQMLGRPDTANELAALGLPLLEGAGSEGEIAVGRQLVGVISYTQGRYEEARAELEQVLAYARSAEDHHLLGRALNVLGNLAATRDGDHAAARGRYRAALRAHRRSGNLEGIIDVTINLGAASYDLKEFAEAERLWEEAAQLATELGYLQRAAVLQNNLGALAGSRGQLDLAESRYLESLALREEIGDRSGTANVLHNLGTLSLRRGDAAAGLGRLREALAIHFELGDEAGVAYARSHLGRALIGVGDTAGAHAEAVGALETALTAGSSSDLLGSLVTLALLHEAQGRPAAALRVARQVSRLAAGSEENIRDTAEEIAARLTGVANEAEDSGPEPVPASEPPTARQVAERELSGMRRARSATGT